MDEVEDDVDRSENTYRELVSSLKSNKQLLRKFLKKNEKAQITGDGEEVPSKKSKIDDNDDEGSDDDNNDDDNGDDNDESDSSESDFSESEESDCDEINKENNSHKDPFKVHYEQVLEETIVDEFDKVKYEKGKRDALNNYSL